MKVSRDVGHPQAQSVCKLKMLENIFELDPDVCHRKVSLGNPTFFVLF